jgi:hypothetical protein
MKFEIVSATSGSKFRYSGNTDTETQIALLSPQAPEPAPTQKQP